MLTFGRRSSARATQKSCRCPTEKLSPFSATRASSPSATAVTASCRNKTSTQSVRAQAIDVLSG